MNRRSASPVLALWLLAALPGCGQAAEPPAGNEADKVEAPAPSAPAPAANAAAPASSTRAASPCPTPQRVELDGGSFVHGDIPAFAPARLEAFRRAAAAAFRSAAEAGCGLEVSPERLARIDRLLVRSASGATETNFYEPEDMPGTLVFEFIFAEADLALPEADDIRLGLACWIDFENEDCAGREP